MMFKKDIHVKAKNEIRFGTTTIGFTRTYNQIINLLQNHGCRQILMNKTDDDYDQIGFVIDDKPYLITVPKVYIKSIYQERIGIRIVFWFLESMLELVKQRIIDIEFLMLPARVITESDGNMVMLGDCIMPQLREGNLVPKLPPGST